MPSGRKPKQREAIELDPAALSKLEEYRLNWEKAMTELIRIRPRDKGFASTPVVNFTFRPAQRKAFDAIQRMRSFNIFRSLKREYPERWQHALSAVTGRQNIPATATGAVEIIFAARPEYVLHHLHTLGYTEASDSPVLMVIIKARQLGFSTLIQIILFLYALFNGRSAALVLSSDEESVQHVLSMTTTLIDEWPDKLAALKPELVGEARDRIELFNKSKYFARTSDGKRIHSITSDIIHATEYAHYLKEDKVAAALVATPSHAWVFYESTSAGPSGDYYEKAKAAITVEQLIANYDAKIPTPERQIIKIFVSWLEDPHYRAKNMEEWEVSQLRDTLDDSEKNLLARFKPGRFDAAGNPLPFCDLARLKWRREKIANDCQRGKDRFGRLLLPVQYFMQEYPADETEAFQEASGAVFPSETLLRIDTEIQAIRPPHTFRIRNEKAMPELVVSDHLANLWVWKLPAQGHHYSIGADTGHGVGLDNTVFTVLDRLDGTTSEQVAEWAFPHLGERASAHICAMLALLYNKAFVVPEDKGTGRAFIEELTHTIGYRNVYFRQQRAKVKTFSSTFDAYGFQTTHQNKNQLIEDVKHAMVSGSLSLSSKQLLHELRMYQFDDPTNPDSPMNARQGERDDRVLSLALAFAGTLANHGAPRLVVAARPNAEDALKEELAAMGSERRADGMSEYDLRAIAATNKMIEKADKAAARLNRRQRRRRGLDNVASYEELSSKWN